MEGLELDVRLAGHVTRGGNCNSRRTFTLCRGGGRGKRRCSGLTLNDVLEDLVPRIARRPVFFIYATHGQGGEELSVDYHAAAREPKLLWDKEEGSNS